MFQIQKEILQATINYLTTQPFNQVHQLINALQQCKPLEPKPKPETPLVEEKPKKS